MISRNHAAAGDVEVEAMLRHTSPAGVIANPGSPGDRYFVSLLDAVSLCGRGLVKIVDEEIAEPVRVVETKEGATVETPAPALSASKDSAPKRRGPKAKVR